jgi:hypothetical protein
MLAQSAINDSLDFNLKGFNPFPEIYNSYDKTSLINKIIPDSKYKYWECWFKHVTNRSKGRLMLYKGDNLLYASKIQNIKSKFGFFPECHPGLCFTYIIAIKDDGLIDTVDSEERLIKFIGHIDNIEEVILLAKCHGYWFNSDTLIGGSYKERENDYLLYLFDSSSFPGAITSVQAILSKDGSLRVLNKEIYKEIYKQTDEYILH